MFLQFGNSAVRQFGNGSSPALNVYIISAPSGSGKSTLVSELRRSVADLDFSISYTTRPPRGSEVNGREYSFITREEFEKMIAAGAFLEHAEVFGNYYGTAQRFLKQAEQAHRDLLLDIDVQGAAQVEKLLPDAVSIFILPPSRQILEKRLRRRSEAEGKVDESVQKVIERRLRTATKEIENYSKYGYILVNDRLEESIDELKAIVLWERIKRSSAQVSIPGDRQRLQMLAERCLLQNAQPHVRQILETFKSDGN